MVGRENELEELKSYLDKAEKGEGSIVFISGEAGIGKTKLVNELKEIAQSHGFQILSGYCMYESLTPFMPIMEALRSAGMESLFMEEAPKVEAVYLVTRTGLLIKEVVRKETKLDPDLFSSVLTTLSDFASQSLSNFLGEETEGTLNSLGFENYRILIKSWDNANMVVIISGKENEFLINDMREILRKTNKRYGKILERWDGDEEDVVGAEELINPLIKSGKYDGIYYGKDDPKIRRNLLFENVSLGMVRIAQQTPTLLCIEDLQWADPSSLALIHYIARNSGKSRLIILGSYRPEDITSVDGKDHPLVGTMHMMDREDLHKKMELMRLPKGSIEEFLEVMLGRFVFGNDFGKRIFKETEGNPLFVIQLVKYLADEEIILNEEGKWTLTKNIEDIEIPSKIYQVIKRRLNRLGNEDRKVLDYASVIGETFTSSILIDVLDMKSTQLLELLRSFEQVHRIIKSNNGNFKFDHAKIKEVLYTEIPTELRMNYHSIIGNSIEKINKDNLDDVIGDLAFHYYQCKNKEKALHYLSGAAGKAKKKYSNEETIRFHKLSLELEEDTEKRMKIFTDLGDIYELIGLFNESLNSYNIALSLTEERKKKSEIRTKIGYVFKNKGDYNEALKNYNNALDLVRNDLSLEEAECLHHMGWAFFVNGKFDKAVEHYETSLTISKKISNHKGIASCYNDMGLIYMERGEYNKALEALEKSLQIRKRIDYHHGIATSILNIGILHENRGDYDNSLDYYKKSQAIFGKIGHQRGVAIAAKNVGDALYFRGDLDTALEKYMKSMEISRRIGSNRVLCFAYEGISLVYLNKNKLQEALEFCNRSFSLCKEIGLKLREARVRRLYGMIYNEQKMWILSADNFEQSIKFFNNYNAKRELAESYFEFGLMWKAKGDVDKSQVHLNKSLEIFKNLRLDKWVEKVNAMIESL
jgi:predicted ATPase